MRARALRLGLGLALVLTLPFPGCAGALWEKSARIRAGNAPARLFVPRTFEPLVPGSIYPDRTRPLPARGLPAVVVVRRRVPARSLAEPLGRRGLVTLVAKTPVPFPVLLERLAARPECGGRFGLLLEEPDAATLLEAFRTARIDAAVVLGPVPPLPAAHPPLLALRVGAAPDASAGDYAQRWYASPKGELPALAFQDAADWLAERLGGGMTRR